MLTKARKFLVELSWPIGISAAALVLWEILVRQLGIRSIILPPPTEIIEAVIRRHDLLLAHLWP